MKIRWGPAKDYLDGLLKKELNYTWAARASAEGRAKMRTKAFLGIWYWTSWDLPEWACFATTWGESLPPVTPFCFHAWPDPVSNKRQAIMRSLTSSILHKKFCPPGFVLSDNLFWARVAAHSVYWIVRWLQSCNLNEYWYWTSDLCSNSVMGLICGFHTTVFSCSKMLTSSMNHCLDPFLIRCSLTLISNKSGSLQNRL